MHGIKKYEVLKKFKEPRKDIGLYTKKSNAQPEEWGAQATIILIHLASMGFLNVSIEKEGELTWQITEDGRLWLQAAEEKMIAEFGRGAA